MLQEPAWRNLARPRKPNQLRPLSLPVSAKKAIQFAERLSSERGEGWSISGKQLIVPVGQNDRIHKIRFRMEENQLQILTIVLDAQTVTQSDQHWRDLALLAWKRNSECDIVSFQFDSRDRLIGCITHPIEYLDFKEFENFVEVLAAESDRFEFLLTGKDRW